MNDGSYGTVDGGSGVGWDGLGRVRLLRFRGCRVGLRGPLSEVPVEGPVVRRAGWEGHGGPWVGPSTLAVEDGYGNPECERPVVLQDPTPRPAVPPARLDVKDRCTWACEVEDPDPNPPTRTHTTRGHTHRLTQSGPNDSRHTHSPKHVSGGHTDTPRPLPRWGTDVWCVGHPSCGARRTLSRDQ